MGGTLSCAGGRYTEKDPDLKPYTCTHGKSSLSSKNSTSSQPVNSPPWKFWRKFSIRRSDKYKHSNDSAFLDNQKTSESLPDVVDRSLFRRSQSLKPPPKPPRLFLFRSSSISTPRNSVIGGSNRNSYVMSQAYQTSRSKDSPIPTAHVAPVKQEKQQNGVIPGENSPNKVNENNNEIDKIKVQNVIEDKNSPSKPVSIAETVESEITALNNSNNSTPRIKIVTPDLTPRRPLGKSRKKSGSETETDRHRNIVQSCLELICQKMEPEFLLDDLLAENVITSVDVQAFRGHPDRRLVCESMMQSIMDGAYLQFKSFCGVLKKRAEYGQITAILEAMMDVYNVIHHIPAVLDGESVSVDEEKAISFEVCYYNCDTGVMKPVVELEKAREKRYSRDSLLMKRSSRISFQSYASECSKLEENDIQNLGTPMVNVCISGHNLHGDRAKSLAGVLDKHECILELHIGKTMLTGKDLGYLSLPLKSNTTLNVLDLRLNQIGNEGAKMLASALQENCHIKQLNLSSTAIESEGCRFLADSLKQNSCLAELDMSFLDIGDSGCISLGNMLKINKSVKRLRLRSANISWIGCGILFEGVQQSKSLLELDLSRNFIGDDGMEMICRHLNEKASLIDLNLENCGVTSSGCSMLSDVVLMNKTLQNLDLSVNFIGDAGIGKLSNALERNKSIKTLGLNMCGITNDGFSKLLDILECNPTLHLLKLCYNRLGREHTNPSATSDDLRYRIRIVTSSNPKLKLLLWGNSFDEA